MGIVGKIKLRRVGSAVAALRLHVRSEVGRLRSWREMQRDGRLRRRTYRLPRSATSHWRLRCRVGQGGAVQNGNAAC